MIDLSPLVAAFPALASYVGLYSVVVALCAALATALPAPGSGASRSYRRTYAVVNFVACNFGHATNAPK